MKLAEITAPSLKVRALELQQLFLEGPLGEHLAIKLRPFKDGIILSATSRNVIFEVLLRTDGVYINPNVNERQTIEPEDELTALRINRFSNAKLVYEHLAYAEGVFAWKAYDLMYKRYAEVSTTSAPDLTKYNNANDYIEGSFDCCVQTRLMSRRTLSGSWSGVWTNGSRTALLVGLTANDEAFACVVPTTPDDPLHGKRWKTLDEAFKAIDMMYVNNPSRRYSNV